MPDPLIILGASARAAAQSARRAGYEPWCIDLFCDRDLRRIATCHRCPAEDYPNAMLRRLDEAPADAPVLLAGAMENYPDLLEAIRFEHRLLGSSVEAIRRARDPLALPSLPVTPGLRLCRTHAGGGIAQRLSRLFTAGWRRYLIKPCISAGGVNVAWWSRGMPVRPDHYLQQYVPGTPLGAVFHADGWSATLLGVTEQLVGEAAFGSERFRWCGAIGPVRLNEAQRAALAHLGVQLTQRYDVRGIFGVDLVLDRRGTLWPIEVNPRYVASIEVLEQAYRVPLLAHITAAAPPSQTRRAHHYHGKAVVYARQETVLDDLYQRFDEHEIADVPEPGGRVAPGRPICTVFAAGASRDDCHARLVERAQRIHEHYAALVPTT